MKLSEIEDTLKDLAQMRIDESPEDYAQRVWDQQPRIPFKDLPLKLQKNVRDRFPPEALLSFIRDCYAAPEFESEVKSMSPEELSFLPFSPDEIVSFESITTGIPEDALQKIILRTRNTATYTIEYDEQNNLAPALYGDHAISAFQEAVGDYRGKQQEKKQRQQQKPAAPARAHILKSVGYYQQLVSDPQYQHGLSTQKNKNAYIALMTPDFLKKLNFSNGVMTYNDENEKEVTGIIRAHSKGKYTDIKDLDFPLLVQIYTAAVKAHTKYDANTITVSMPEFFREMGISLSKGNAPDVMAKLQSFENCYGIMPGMRIIAKLFTIIELDLKNQTMTFAVPYILRLYETLEKKNHIDRTTRKGEILAYTKPFLNTLCHSTIASERNKAAVEIVYLITNGLLQRGYEKDVDTYRKKGAISKHPDRITYSISFRQLINKAPVLRGRIQSYKTTADQNKALRRAFEKAYQLIEAKTDAAEWFIHLQYGKVIPTMTTLDDELIFTHEGRNADYVRKK